MAATVPTGGLAAQWLEWSKENIELEAARWWALMATRTDEYLEYLSTVTLDELRRTNPSVVFDDVADLLYRGFAREELQRRTARARIKAGEPIDYREVLPDQFLKHNAVAATATNDPDDWACVDYALDQQHQREAT